MDYVIGSVAALVSGDVTPNRPRPMKKALTPTKHQPSPNVTPKSEFVNDRSIFLSPSIQKKNAVVKKSPKRIFQNSELEAGDENEASLTYASPKTDKVKKFLQDELNYDQRVNKSLGKSTSPSLSIGKISNLGVSQNTNENTEKKEKLNNSPMLLENVSEHISSAGNNLVKKKNNDCNKKNKPNETENRTSDTIEKSPKKKSKLNNVENMVFTDENKIDSALKKKRKRCKKKSKQPVKNISESHDNVVEKLSTINCISNQGTPMKINRKLKKSKSEQTKQENSEIEVPRTQKDDLETLVKCKKIKTIPNIIDTISDSGQQDHKVEPDREEVDQYTGTNTMLTDKNKNNTTKKKNKLFKKKLKETGEDGSKLKENLRINTVTEKEIPNHPEKKNKKRKKPKLQLITEDSTETEITNIEKSSSQSLNSEIEAVNDKAKTVVNPNAITNKESDSEHESDDEIESENEVINNQVFDSQLPVDGSTDEEEELQEKDQVQKPKAEKNKGMNIENLDVNTVDEIKRTLFVGNVPFSAKCKKEIKKIFNKHGKIETIRIRTIPVKDGRYTPKLAVIKNELHPERSTVNVYIKYADEESVDKALSENNTLLNEHHLRVSRSSQTGKEHDPKCSIFVGNLPFAIEDEVLRQKFENCGEIESVRIIRDKKTNAGKGFGYVNFFSKDGVELALALTDEDLTMKNRIIRVKRCTQLTNKQKQRDNYNKAESQFNQGNQNVQDKNQGGQRLNKGFQRYNQSGHRENRAFQRGNLTGHRGSQSGHRENQAFQRGNQSGQRGNQSFQRSNQSGQRSNQGFQRDTQGDRRVQYQGGQRLENNDEELRDGAYRRIMNKRKNQDGPGDSDAPPNKIQKDSNLSNKEKKGRKEFVGMTAEKKKKRKFDKGQKKKKALSEILTK